jgi:hypothetical protein
VNEYDDKLVHFPFNGRFPNNIIKIIISFDCNKKVFVSDLYLKACVEEEGTVDFSLVH